MSHRFAHRSTQLYIPPFSLPIRIPDRKAVQRTDRQLCNKQVETAQKALLEAFHEWFIWPFEAILKGLV